MTPDRRIFDRLLPLLPTAIVVDWIPPIEHESIVSYADRLSRTINHDEPMVVCLLPLTHFEEIAENCGKSLREDANPSEHASV